MLSELIHSALHSTPQGYLGVGLIFFYMCLIVGTAVVRIKQNIEEDHH